jgi:branched-subunit amino acid ABC-type transport system permease component
MVPDLGPFLISGLSTGAVYVLSGVGLVILFQSSGVVNLAQGAVGALSALIAWNIADSGGPPWVGWIAGIVAATVVSLAYGRLIAPRLAYSDPIVRAVATLGFALIILGFMELVWGEWPRGLRLPTDALGFRVLGVRITYTRLIAMALSLAITGGVIVFFSRSKLGLAMRALANNREISGLLGVPILRVDAWAWVMSGAIAGVSGILLANMVRLQALILTFLVIPAIAAAIAGRMRSLYATVIGGLLIGIVEAVATPFPYVGSVRGLAPFVFAIAALLWLQRRGQTLVSASSGFGETDQSVYRASAVNGRRDLLLRVGMGIAGAIVVAALVPEIANAYWLKTLSSVVILALASLCVGVIYAQLGMVSLCQFALVGVGGWFALRLYHATHLPFECSILAGGISAAIFGLIFGLPALRMRGLYLALTTLMIAGGFQVAISAIEFPDGGPGIIGKMVSGQRSWMGRPAVALSDPNYFRYCVAFLVIGYLIVLWHKHSRAGRAWAMIRRSEVCALAAGVNIVRYKVWAFTLAGFLAGVAGALLSGLVGQMEQGAFPASESVLLFALTVIGGAGHWAGPIVAGLLLRAFPALLNDFSIDGNIATMIFGIGLLHALITAPQGVSGQLVDLSRLIKTKAGRLWVRKTA